MPLPAGTRLGPYEILAPIGAGGMGVVYSARDVRLERTVALKFLPPEVTGDAGLRDRLQREARAASRLDHPNIGVIHGIEETDDGRTFIVMAFYEGETLRSRMRLGTVPEGEAATVAAQIAEGLGEAHSKGVIHRDIKPSNLILTPQGGVKIIDFGLARLLDQGTQIHPGHVAGTAAYMSPEQAQGKVLDGRSDLWALGVVLFEMLAGRLPFHGETTPAMLYGIVHQTPEYPAHLSERWRTLLEGLLAKDPTGRFPNAAAFLTALKRPSGNSTIETRTMVRATGSFRRREQWGPRYKLAVGAAVLVVCAGLGWYLTHQTGSVPTGSTQLAVLPFRNAGNDPATEVATDGLVEMLSSRLAALDSSGQSLRVVAASEVRHRNVITPADAVHQLGVNRVVSGSVERNGSDIRLTVTLLDPRSRKEIGSATLMNSAGDFPALEEGAVRTLARFLHLDAKATKLPAASPAAYQQYLEAMGYVHRWDQKGSLDKAITLFQSAVRSDPSFHLADAGLAEAYRLYYGLDNDDKWVKLALPAANRALAADPNMEPVYVTLGRIHLATGQNELARAEFEHALVLAPRDTDAMQGIAQTYEKLGRNGEAEKMFHDAAIQRPDAWEGYYRLGNFYYRQHRFQEAEAQYRHVLELTPDNASADTNLGEALNKQNRYAEARVVLEKAVDLNGTYATYNNLANVYFLEGSYAEAAAFYEKARDLNDSDYMVWGNLGEAYLAVPALAARAHAVFEKAATLAEQKAREAPPASVQEATVQGDLGGFYARLKLPAKARPRLESAIALGRRDPAVLVNVAGSYAVLGDLPRARTEFRKALKQGASLEYAKRMPALREIALESEGAPPGK